MTNEPSIGSTSTGLVPFKKGEDPRRGRGPSAGAANAGRPPDAVRAACRAAFDERVPMLADLADSGTPDIRLRAMEMLGRYGLGTSFTLEGQERPHGIIVLPALEIPDYVARAENAGTLPYGSGEDSDLEYVIEELDVPRLSAGETAYNEETVSPDIVREVLARRRQVLV